MNWWGISIFILPSVVLVIVSIAYNVIELIKWAGGNNRGSKKKTKRIKRNAA